MSTRDPYAEAGVDYTTLDAAKRRAVAAARATSSNPATRGAVVDDASRGEPATVVRVGDASYAFVLECLGTKSLIARDFEAVTGVDRYDSAGYDTVAAAVNDCCCVGALPLVVNAYFATGAASWGPGTPRSSTGSRGPVATAVPPGEEVSRRRSRDSSSRTGSTSPRRSSASCPQASSRCSAGHSRLATRSCSSPHADSTRTGLPSCAPSRAGSSSAWLSRSPRAGCSARPRSTRASSTSGSSSSSWPGVSPCTTSATSPGTGCASSCVPTGSSRTGSNGCPRCPNFSASSPRKRGCRPPRPMQPSTWERGSPATSGRPRAARDRVRGAGPPTALRAAGRQGPYRPGLAARM